jgi:hypothetical protein
MRRTREKEEGGKKLSSTKRGGREMAVMTFDTLELVKRLRESCFNEKQAEALSDALKVTQRFYVEELVTKHDLKEMEYRLTGEIIKWVAGILVLPTGVILSAVFAMFKLLSSAP